MNNRKIGISTLIILSIFFTSIVSPVPSEAKNKGKDNSKSEKIEKTDENKKDRQTKKCFRAWGHLFSKGWLKKNSVPELDENCFVPFGISKKFKGNGTTTPDVLAPVISNIDFAANTGRAVITWTTDEKSDSYVFYSTNSPVNTNSSSTPVFGTSNKTKNHWVALNNLSAGTTYYAVIRSRDSSGNTSLSNQFSFSTHLPNTNGDTQAPTISNIVSSTGTTSVNIGWRTNEFSTSKVYYSSVTPVNLATANSVENSSLNLGHVIITPNLNSGTRYYFVIESKDPANNISRTSEFSLNTLASTSPDNTPPIISSIGTSVSSSTIQVSWITNEPSTSKVYYNANSGVNTNSTSTPFVIDNNLKVNHSLILSGLSTSTLYNMVIESKDAIGNTSTSVQFTSSTLAN